ncbi:MAG: Rab family GTPase [Candidatus Njordarchaeia archaeon]
MLETEKAYLKISFMGDSAVGKTSLIRAYMGEPVDVQSTIGVEVYSLEKDNRKYIIWDFSGQKWFADILIDFVKGTKLLVLVFDLSEPRSLANIFNFWAPNITKQAENRIPILLVGNKLDIKKINEDELGKFVEKLKEHLNIVDYITTSVYMEETVKCLFKKILEWI